MTENLLQKLEEKTLALLAEVERSRKEVQEVERLRKEVQQLRHENALLNRERQNSLERLEAFLSLLNTIYIEDSIPNTTLPPAKPVLVQG